MKRSLLLFAMLAAGGASPLAAADIVAPAFDMDIPLSSVMPAAKQPAIVKALTTLRAGAVLTTADLVAESGGASALEPYIGMELKRAVYVGKPLSLGDVGQPTVVQRNAMVQLEFQRGPLVITTEGRALDAGAVGDAVRVMNLNSKIVLTAVVAGPNKAITR